MRVWNEDDSLNHTIEWIKKFKRCLVLTPRNMEAMLVKKKVELLLDPDYSLFEAKELEITKKNFLKSNKGIAILANRYDGIDLSGEECRYLIISVYICRFGRVDFFNTCMSVRTMQK